VSVLREMLLDTPTASGLSAAGHPVEQDGSADDDIEGDDER